MSINVTSFYDIIGLFYKLNNNITDTSVVFKLSFKKFIPIMYIDIVVGIVNTTKLFLFLTFKNHNITSSVFYKIL